MLGCLTLATALAWAGPATAGASECPRLGDVVTELGQVLAADAAATAASEIILQDQGASWSIEVRGHQSSYADPSRDCRERARVAAVFAALALEPPDAGEVGAQLAPRSAPPPPQAGSYALEIAPLFALATIAGGASAVVGWGGQARVSRAGKPVGLSLGLEAATLSRMDLGSYGASITRAPVDLSVRLGKAFGPWALAGELGAYVAYLRVRGSGLLEDRVSTHADVGARVAVLARLRSRLAPFLSVQAEMSARRFDLAVDPSGTLGSAPRLWVSALAGGVFDL